MYKKSYYFFISDLHLDQDTDKLNIAYKNFLNKVKSYIDKGNVSLFILGDFHAKAIKDVTLPWFKDLSSKMRELSMLGVSIYFLVGNRDFLLNKNFCDDFQGTFLEENSILELDLLQSSSKIYSYNNSGAKINNGKKVRFLLAHGDNFCIADLGYQKFRKIIRSPFIFALSRLLPTSFANYIANTLRKKSEKKQSQPNKDKTQPIHYDIDLNYVDSLMLNKDITYTIFGHVHKQRILVFNSFVSKVLFYCLKLNKNYKKPLQNHKLNNIEEFELKSYSLEKDKNSFNSISSKDILRRVTTANCSLNIGDINQKLSDNSDNYKTFISLADWHSFVGNYLLLINDPKKESLEFILKTEDFTN